MAKLAENPENTQIISQYTVLEKVAETALSEVFLVENKESKKYCLKVLKNNDEFSDEYQLFKREAKLLASVDSPLVLKVVDFGFINERPFICTKYVQGNDLSVHIQNKTFNLEQKLQIMSDLAHGVKVLHEAGVIHRDIKPMNILTAIEDKISVTIADLGLAGESGQELNSHYAGTIDYSAPEQLGIINTPVDMYSDLYSLGVIFYELLVGELPFQVSKGESAGQITPEVEQKLLNLKELPPIISAIVAKLIQGNPSQRYQSALGLAYDLDFAITKIKEGETNPRLDLDEKSKSLQLANNVFVGRENEMLVLEQSFAELKKNKFKFATVGGVAGVGKSSIISEMQNRSALDGAILCYGKSYEFASGIPYNSVSEALNSLHDRLMQMSEDKRQLAFDVIREAVGDLGAELVSLAPKFKPHVKIDKAVPVLSPDKEKARLCQLIKNIVENLTEKFGQLVIFLDDLQWADRSTVDLIKNLHDDPPSCGLMVVGSYRSETEYKDNPFYQLFDLKGITDVKLKPFQPSETRLMMGESLGVAASSIDESLLKLVQERTSGNPLFVAEILKKLVSEGVIHLQGERILWDSKKVTEMKLPDSVTKLVISRVSELSADEIEIIATSAVIGVDFDIKVLAFLTNKDPSFIYDTLSMGIKKQIYKKRGVDRYSFFHDKVHESCVDLNDKNTLPSVHLKIAKYLEASEDVESHIFDLAEHSINANDRERSIKYGVQAGKKAFERHVLEKTEYYFSKAVELLGSTIEDNTVPAYVGLADVYASKGNYEKSQQLLEEVMEKYSITLEDEVGVLTKLAECKQRAGDYQEARTYLHTALGRLDIRTRESSNRFLHLWDKFLVFLFSTKFGNLVRTEKMQVRYHLAADVLRKLWMVQVIFDMKPLLDISYRMLFYATVARNQNLLAVAHQYLSFSLMNQDAPQTEKVFFHAKKSIQIAKACGDNEVVAGSMVRLAAYNNWTGNFEESKKYADEARDILIAMGNLWDVGNAIIFSFFGNKSLGRLKPAVSDAYSLRQLGEKTGSAGMLASGTCKVAEMAFLNGKTKEHDELIEKGLSLAEKNNLEFDRFQLLKAKGYAALNRGNFRDARGIFAEAVAIIENGKASFFKAYLSFAYLGFCESTFLDDNVTTGDPSFKLAMKYLKLCHKREQHYSELGWVEKCYGLSEIKLSNTGKAMEYFKKALDIYAKQKRPLEGALVKIEMARHLVASDIGRANQLAQEAQEVLSAYGLNWPTQRLKSIVGLASHNSGGGSNDDKQSSRLEEVLIQIGTASTTSLNQREQAISILDKVVEVVEADRALLFLTGDNGLEFYIGRDKEKEAVTEAKKYSQSFVLRLSNSKEALLMTGNGEDDVNPTHSVVAHNLLSIMGAPIYCDGELKGVLYVDSKLEKGLYTKNDGKLLWSIAQQLGISIKTQEMAEIEVKNAIFERDLELAGAVQNLLLPDYHEFSDQHYDLCSYYQAAAQASGDWWWHHQVNEKRHFVFMGDVTGHGAGAAMVTAYVSGVANTLLSKDVNIEPETFIREINEKFYKSCGGSFNMTFNLVDLNFGTGEATFWFAAAPEAFVFNQGETKFVSARSSLLGNEKLILKSITQKLEAGMKLMILSDGIIEAPLKNGRCLMSKRFSKLVEKYIDRPCREALKGVIDDFNERRAPGDLPDDISVIMMEIK